MGLFSKKWVVKKVNKYRLTGKISEEVKYASKHFI